MLEVSYRFQVDYPIYTILSQYYDYEHIRTVHPETLGEYRLVEVRDGGRDIVYDHLWPAKRGGPRPVSRVRHRYLPPLSMEFEFLDGRYRGTRVSTHLAPEGPGSTLIEETYFIPGLPNWRWLARCLKPFVMRPVNRIWKEDLDVGICIDGWPGVPVGVADGMSKMQPARVYPILPPRLTCSEVPEGTARGFLLDRKPLAVVHSRGVFHGLGDRCPHTGGPLSAGTISADLTCIECPWHGAKFNLKTGRLERGPGSAGVDVFELGDAVRGEPMDPT